MSSSNVTVDDETSEGILVTHFLEPRQSSVTRHGSPEKTALVILNAPLEDLEYFRRLYDHALLRVCADGGANRLHRLLIDQVDDSLWREALQGSLPNIIHGDLDSLDDGVRKRYEQLGVEILKDPDQYSTDFGKCIKLILKRLPDVKDILVLGSIGGRVDQGVGLLHELYREQNSHPEVKFWFFSEASISLVLQPGTTTIHTPLEKIRTPPESGLIKRNVGILPVYGPAKISWKGVEYEVDDWPTEMGGQVSTSNHITADQLSITTDKAVLFTVERAINR
jgi:thiamine pyrophosphokinase